MTSFTKANFVYEGWNSNGDAHRIARSSIYNYVGRYVWFIDPMEFVPAIVLLDNKTGAVPQKKVSASSRKPSSQAFTARVILYLPPPCLVSKIKIPKKNSGTCMET